MSRLDAWLQSDRCGKHRHVFPCADGEGRTPITNHQSPITNLVLLLLLLSIGVASCAAPATQLAPGELAVLEAVDLALATEHDHGEEIWPGFSLVEEPLLIHRPGGRSFLVAAPATVDGVEVTRPSLSHLPRVLEIPAEEISVNPSVLFSRDVPIRGVTAFMIRHTDAMKPLRFFRLLVHEVFHRHQHRHFLGERTQPLCRYPMEDRDLVAGALVEQRRLATALTATDDDDARRSLRRYIGYRLSRYDTAAAGLDAHTIEDWEERLEGTARFVEERYVAAADLVDAAAATRALAASLQDLPPKDLQKWRYYKTGAALLHLAARLIPGDPWSQRVDDGQAPFDVAMGAGGSGPVAPAAPDPRVLDEARAVVTPALDAQLETERALLEAWPDQGSLHVVVVAKTAAAVTYSGRGVTFHLPDCSRFISQVTWFVDRDAGLDVRDRSVLLDGARGEDAYRLEFHGDLATSGALRLDGADISGAPGEHRFSASLEIGGDRWRLDHRGAGSLVIHPGGLRVELGEIPRPPP